MQIMADQRPHPDEPTSSSLATRNSLLLRVNLGDESAWRDFFETYWKLIYHFGRKAGFSDADAQDLVQDVMVNVTKALPTFEPDPGRARFKTWLLTIASRRIVDRRRRASRQPKVAEMARAEACGEEAELEQIWEGEWQRHLIEAATQAVKQLVPARQFLVYEMIVHQGVPVRDVCSALAISTANVYLTKHRVAKLMQRELRRQLGSRA